MRIKIFLICFMIGALFLEIIAQSKTVTIDQRLSTGQQTGVLKKWETTYWSNAFNPGTVFTFPINLNQVILGDQTIQSNQKYNNWNGDKTEVKNFHSFPITSQTNDLTSKFEPTHTGINIKTSLEGTTTTGGVIEFKDPWFIDYQDGQYANQLRNRGMNDAYPRQRTSPIYPSATTQYEYEQKYNGVFLA
jgi:hypothetical protein